VDSIYSNGLKFLLIFIRFIWDKSISIDKILMSYAIMGSAASIPEFNPASREAISKLKDRYLDP